ncbi:MAG: hypothetical protein JJU29_21160 [Verrucomicrobia bacterium]|nr:hypothetical protein [Verrucomicrobiota bacterium]MCH8514531.1 hypothetical protein [Kiritimatiellia bacterium]
MFIVFGNRVYGKVDQTSSGCHLATSFFHICFLPVIPLGSFIITQKHGGQWSGIPVKLSSKSVLTAYLRGLFGAGILVLFLDLLFLPQAIQAGMDREEFIFVIVSGLFGLASLAGMILSYKWRFFSKANPEKEAWIHGHFEWEAREATEIEGDKG